MNDNINDVKVYIKTIKMFNCFQKNPSPAS